MNGHTTSQPKTDFPAKRCGVLGATGSVGQRFILLLAQHPHFKLTAVGASPRSAGKKYRDAVKWKQSTRMSDALGNLVVKECTPEAFEGEVDIVFSGLDSDVAGEAGKSSHIGEEGSLLMIGSRDGVPETQHSRLLKREKLPQRPPCPPSGADN